MPISILGPAWPTVAAVRQVLSAAPETGEYRLGGAPTDSITQLTKFREAGLLTPDFTDSLTEAAKWVLEGCTVFGRNFIHTRGNDICLPGRLNLRGQYSRRWTNSQWWSRYIPPTEEWRIHVFDKQTIARGRKVHSHPDQTWRRAQVRNIGNGWAFDFRTDPPKGLRTAAKKAVSALGYPVGAVDILQVTRSIPESLEPPTNDFYILEVNRLPALTCPYTLGRWCDAIRRHVGEGV